MKEGMNSGWRQEDRFFGIFNGYTVQAFKYVSPDGEVGWHTTSWPMRDPIHDFWVSGTDFYGITIHFANPLASHRNTMEIFGIIENIDSAERTAVLEAIQSWEKRDTLTKHPLPITFQKSAGIPYKIDGFRSRTMELSDPSGPDNVIDGDFNFVLTLDHVEHRVEVHAKLVMASNLFERLVEVYPPQLPLGINIRADELQIAVRSYLFAFLNTEEVLKDFKDHGTFS